MADERSEQSPKVSFSLRLGPASNQRMVLSGSTGSSALCCIQRSSSIWPLKVDFIVPSQDSSIKRSSPRADKSFSSKSDALMRNGFCVRLSPCAIAGRCSENRYRRELMCSIMLSVTWSGAWDRRHKEKEVPVSWVFDIPIERKQAN